MNAIAAPLLWGIGQVTVVALVTVFLYLLASRSGPRSRAAIAVSGLLASAVLSVLALSPWPCWEPRHVPAAAGASVPSTSPATPTQAPDPSKETSAQLPPAMAEGSSPSTGFSLATARALVETLFQPENESPRPKRSLAEDATDWGLFAVGLLVVLGLGRFAAGWWSVRGLRRRAHPVVDHAAMARLDALKAKIGYRRPVLLHESSEVTTAAALGCRHPLILLPSGWRSWTDAELSAVLAHELAHLRRSDAVVNLIAQAALIVQFYHPLSHWLLRRLRLEQELAADAEAAAISGGRERYLRSLAGLALERDSMRLAWPAGAFLPTRHTLMKRIEMLRYTDSLRERCPRITRNVAIVTLVLCGVAASGFRPVPADAPRDPQSPQAADPPTGSPDGVTESGTQQGLPDVLAYVPDDAKLVGKVKIAKLLDSPQFAPLKNVIEQMGANGKSDFSFDQIEEFAVFVRDVVPGTSLRPYNVIRYRDAVPDFGPATDDKVILREKRTLVIAGFPSRRGGPPERTLTIDDLKPDVPITRRPLVARFADADAMLFGDIAGIRRGLDGLVQQSPALAATIQPLLEDVNQTALGMELGSGAEQIIVADTEDAEGAKRVKQTVEALVTLARNALTQLENRTDPSVPTSEMRSTAIDIAQRLLATASIDADGARVTASFRSDDALLASTVAVLVPAVKNARAAAKQAQSANNLKQIGLALHNYHAANGYLPPAVIVDNGVKRSWRVELLPYLDQKELYDRYRKDQPWDSEANREVLAEMPLSFKHPGDDRQEHFASYFAVIGSDDNGEVSSAWKPEGSAARERDRDADEAAVGGVRFRQITDGTSNTICVVAARREIPWTKPEDISVDLSRPVDPAQFGGFSHSGFGALFADGSVRFLARSIDPKVLKTLFTRDGREAVQNYARPLSEQR